MAERSPNLHWVVLIHSTFADLSAACLIGWHRAGCIERSTPNTSSSRYPLDLLNPLHRNQYHRHPDMLNALQAGQAGFHPCCRHAGVCSLAEGGLQQVLLFEANLVFQEMHGSHSTVLLLFQELQCIRRPPGTPGCPEKAITSRVQALFNLQTEVELLSYLKFLDVSEPQPVGPRKCWRQQTQGCCYISVM